MGFEPTTPCGASDFESYLNACPNRPPSPNVRTCFQLRRQLVSATVRQNRRCSRGWLQIGYTVQLQRLSHSGSGFITDSRANHGINEVAVAAVYLLPGKNPLRTNTRESDFEKCLSGRDLLSLLLFRSALNRKKPSRTQRFRVNSNAKLSC
jgi:hypothetical protein